MAECLSKNTSLEDQRLQASRLHCGSGAVAQAAWDDPFAGAGTSLWRSFSSNEWADSAQTRAGATTEEALSQAVPRRTRRACGVVAAAHVEGAGAKVRGWKRVAMVKNASMRENGSYGHAHYAKTLTLRRLSCWRRAEAPMSALVRSGLLCLVMAVANLGCATTISAPCDKCSYGNVQMALSASRWSPNGDGAPSCPSIGHSRNSSFLPRFGRRSANRIALGVVPSRITKASNEKPWLNWSWANKSRNSPA